jgi:ADP-heptose:LPS heptosyltransferase
LKSVRAVKALGYDTAIDFSNLLKSGYITKKSGAARRIGFDRLREGNFLFTNQRLTGDTGHMIERYFKLLAPFDIREIPERIDIFVPEEKKKTIDDFLKEHVDPHRPLVILNPHGTWPNKLYPNEKYGHVADRLLREKIQVVLAWGGQAERDAVEKMAGGMEETPVIAPPTDLKELFYLLGKATIYLGNDTGPMHMAAAAQTGVVALFGPTDPARVGPWTKKSRVVTLKDLCDKWPCERRKCSTPDCITRIDPDDVLEAAMDLIEECS